MKNLNTIYVGIDFSKEKFNACLRMNMEIMGETEFSNSQAGYLKLIRWVKKTSELGKNLCYDNVLFCGEHTGSYSIGLSEYLYAKGMKMWLENALTIKYGSGFQRRKDDKTDARMIALFAERFYQEGKSQLFVPETPALKNLRSLYNFRQRVVRDRVAIGNALSAGTYDYSAIAKRQMTKRHREGIEDEKEIRKEMIALVTGTPELATNYRILTSFKGVGPITAAVLLIYTSNFTRFDNPRKFACFSGIAPFGKQSGTSINATPHVSRFAHIGVKAAMVEAAKSAIRTNPVIMEYAARLRQKGKPEGIIINNVKNKIIHILFKMIATQTEWNDQYNEIHIGGNLSPRHLGVFHQNHQNGATEAAPKSDIGVQTSPSALGGSAKLRKFSKKSKMSKISSVKICTET